MTAFSSLRHFLPQERSDIFACTSAIVLISMVTVTDLIVFYRLFVAADSLVSLALFFLVGIFLLFNVLGNMYQAMGVDTSIHSIAAPGFLLQPEWRYCSACELNAPPRSIHCFTCQRCVLKRHNHCMFLGKCVGHKTLRFYLLFIAYVWLGAVFTNALNWIEVSRLVTEFSGSRLLITFMPLLAWALGFISLVELPFVFVNSSTMVLCILMIVYLAINLRIALVNGQTWRESTKNIQTYKLSLSENWLEIFGAKWPLALCCPFVSSELPSDGTKFRKAFGSDNDESGAGFDEQRLAEHMRYGASTNADIKKRAGETIR